MLKGPGDSHAAWWHPWYRDRISPLAPLCGGFRSIGTEIGDPVPYLSGIQRYFGDARASGAHSSTVDPRSWSSGRQFRPRPEEREARRTILQAALSHLEKSRSESDSESAEVYEDLAQHYRHRLATLAEEDATGAIGSDASFHQRFNELSRELLRVERQTAVRLRNQHHISDELLREIERELDLGEARLSAKH